MIYIKKYRKIVDRLIGKSFPQLKDEKVEIVELSKYLFWWAGGDVIKFGHKYFIIVTNKIRDFDNKILRGFFVHELCHVEDYKKEKVPSFLKNPFYYFKEWLSWVFGTSFSRKLERKTDIKTIKKGYGKELLKLTSEREKRLSKSKLNMVYSRGYLSPKEIKQEMKKLK